MKTRISMAFLLAAVGLAHIASAGDAAPSAASTDSLFARLGGVDRVALITNADPETRPADRAAAITPEALAFLVRMGASHLQASTLFALWKLSLNDAAHARAQVDRWYEQEAGTFQFSPSHAR